MGRMRLLPPLQAHLIKASLVLSSDSDAVGGRRHQDQHEHEYSHGAGGRMWINRLLAPGLDSLGPRSSSICFWWLHLLYISYLRRPARRTSQPGGELEGEEANLGPSSACEHVQKLGTEARSL